MRLKGKSHCQPGAARACKGKKWGPRETGDDTLNNLAYRNGIAVKEKSKKWTRRGKTGVLPCAKGGSEETCGENAGKGKTLEKARPRTSSRFRGAREENIWGDQ